MSLRKFIIAILLLAFTKLTCAAEPSLKISEAEAKKAATEKSAPVYPMTARQLKVTGKVVVEATVSEAGDVSEVRPVSGNPILTKPALEAVKKWRFKPFLAEGKPAPAVVTLSFEFDTK